MNRYLFQMVFKPSRDYFFDNVTGKWIRFSCDRENIIEITAVDEQAAVFLAEYQGLKEDVHYNDICTLMGVIKVGSGKASPRDN